MPQAINIKGSTTRRPGVFATVDVSALSGLTLDINRVAVLGSFPMLEQAKPIEFSTAIDMAGHDPSDVNVARIAKLLYRPSTDDRVQGGPSATILVSVNESAQALTELKAALKSQLTLKSNVWGLTGNRVTGSYTATDNTLSLNRDGLTESFTDLGDTGYIALYYNGTKATTATAKFGPETGVKIDIEWKIDSSASVAGEEGVDGGEHITLNGAELDELAFDGTLSFQVTTEAGVSTTLDGNKQAQYTITGTLKATGAATVEVLTLASAGVGPTVSSAFSSITEIKIVELNQDDSEATISTARDFEVKNTAFDLPAASYPKLQSIYDTINSNVATHKFVVSSTNPKLASVYTNTIDEGPSQLGVAQTIIGVGATRTVSRNLQSIVDAVNNGSILCTATRSTISEDNNIGCLEPYPDQTFQLAGGAKDLTESQADWDLAIDALKSQNIQIIVPITDDTNNSGVASSLVAHCKHMAGTGAAERNFWYGVPAATMVTTDLIIAASKAINSRHGSVVAQKVKLFDHLSQIKTMDPTYLAVMLAGIQAGTAIAVPMTHKRIDIIDTVHSWDSTSKAEQLIRNGVCIITQDRLGFRVERSVTTYLTDDNPVFSEVSANESLNTCIRDLRNFLVTRIGDQNVNGTAQLVRTIALTRLRQQVLDGIIKAFDAKALQVVDLGDRLRVDARIAVIEPLNFIVINAEVVRMTTAA